MAPARLALLASPCARANAVMPLGPSPSLISPYRLCAWLYWPCSVEIASSAPCACGARVCSTPPMPPSRDCGSDQMESIDELPRLLATWPSTAEPACIRVLALNACTKVCTALCWACVRVFHSLELITCCASCQASRYGLRNDSGRSFCAPTATRAALSVAPLPMKACASWACQPSATARLTP